MSDDPGQVYGRLLAEAEAALAGTTRRFARIGNARLVVFLVGVVAALAIATRRIEPWWIVVPVVGFIVLAVAHERVHRRQGRAARAAAFYRRGLDRLSGAWTESGSDGSGFRDSNHVYADDLDLFGRGSLFHYLSAARTGAGEHALASWLRAPAPVEVVRARQSAVRELAPRLPFRELLAVAGEDARAGLDSTRLARWIALPPVAFPGLARVWCLVVGAGAALAGVAVVAGLVSSRILVPVFAVGWLTAGWFRSRTAAVLRAVDAPARDLALMAELLAVVEADQYDAPALRDLRDRLRTATGQSAATAIRRLRWLVDLNEARRNQLFWPLAALVLLGTQVAILIEQWRRLHGASVVAWIDAIGELEALASFAAVAFEHPADGFPVLEPDRLMLEAEALGHPLIPEAAVVRNDVALDETCRLLVVSGSNMSGKSTFLRSIGANVVLALAGAPVRARAFRVTPFAIGASLASRDSLLEGRSRFYAEILRLRDVVRLTDGSRPVLFLLDELLAGTNSHDRAIGAEGVLHALLDRGAVGLVTTHDLALAAIADQEPARARNVHFEDELRDGRLYFDYRLRDGVVRRSNALELMRSVGL